MGIVDILAVISAAFFGSFGHCLGMCGGIVIAYSSSKIDKNWSKKREILAHLLYSFGRVTTYTFLGAIFGYLGGVAQFNGVATGILTIIAGIFMILAGLSLIGKIKFLTKLEYSLSSSSFYKRAFLYLIKDRSLYSFFLLGLLNGLLPCGLVYFFAVEAASSGSPFWGALIMFIFGISTIPALLGLGIFSSLFTKTSFRSVMINLAALVVVIYGVYTIYRGYDFIIHPQKSLLNCCESEADVKKQESNITFENYFKEAK
ncbi:MAG: sulfite exporter TauE/SafE family protein [Epsilonproteobacteria bacterium]|nr:sulfite exporter TauE/SafE family protein [Campylobacterota bacterium]